MIRSWRRIVAFPLAAALLILTAGCGGLPGRAQPVDLSTPQFAANAYVRAMQRGDAATARAASVGTGQEMEWVDALASMIDGIRKLNDAIYARFGRYTSQLHTDLEDSLRALADEPVELIQNGSVQVSQTQARVMPAHKGFRSRYQLPLELRNVNGLWKVDLEQTYVPPPPHGQLMSMSPQDRANYISQAKADLSAAFRKYAEAADVFHSVARDVRAGRFKSQDEIKLALAQKMGDIRLGND